jgi:hypothetical protein
MWGMTAGELLWSVARSRLTTPARFVFGQLLALGLWL